MSRFFIAQQKARRCSSLAQETGIDESALAKFYNGQRGLSTDALDRLGEYLGLRIEMTGQEEKGK